MFTPSQVPSSCLSPCLYPYPPEGALSSYPVSAAAGLLPVESSHVPALADGMPVGPAVAVDGAAAPPSRSPELVSDGLPVGPAGSIPVEPLVY